MQNIILSEYQKLTSAWVAFTNSCISITDIISIPTKAWETSIVIVTVRVWPTHWYRVKTFMNIWNKNQFDKLKGYSWREIQSEQIVTNCSLFQLSLIPLHGLLLLIGRFGSVTLYPLMHEQLWLPTVLLQIEFGPQTSDISTQSSTSIIKYVTGKITGNPMLHLQHYIRSRNRNTS